MAKKGNGDDLYSIKSKAVDDLVKILTKAEGTYVDANDVDSIIKAAEGVDLIVNALPIRFAPKVLDAAIAVKANYQDFAATDVLDEWWPKCVEIMYDEYGKKFAENGKMAIIGTGSAPGMMCVATKSSMRYLDTCDDILMMVYEGVEAKRKVWRCNRQSSNRAGRDARDSAADSGYDQYNSIRRNR